MVKKDEIRDNWKEKMENELKLRGYSKKTSSSYFYHVGKFLDSGLSGREFLLKLIEEGKSRQTVRQAGFAIKFFKKVGEHQNGDFIPNIKDFERGVAFLKDWRLRLLPIARHIIQYQHKSKGPDIRNTALKNLVPTYQKYPIQSIYQVLDLLAHVRKDLHKVSVPALLFHSPNDRTVHFDNLEYIFSQISSNYKEKIVLEKSYHVISIDVEKELVFNKTVEFIKNITAKLF